MSGKLTCADCGKLMRGKAGSLPQGLATCHECRRIRPKKPAPSRANKGISWPKDGPTCCSCGGQMYSGKGVLPQGEAMCRPCRSARPKAKPTPKPPAPRFPVACARCGCTFTTTRRKQRYCTTTCSEAGRSWARARVRPSPTERGYGTAHTKARKAAADKHHILDLCVRCGDPLGDMGPHLHYDHNEDRTGYLGFAHAACNSRAGAVKGNRRSHHLAA